MATSIERHRHYTAIAVQGELDSLGLSEFERAIRPVVNANDTVVVDLEHLSYIDSSGLGALIKLFRSAETQGRKVMVVVQSEYLRRLLAISGIDRLVAVVSDKTEITKFLRGISRVPKSA